jgi:hypothetical protein
MSTFAAHLGLFQQVPTTLSLKALVRTRLPLLLLALAALSAHAQTYNFCPTTLTGAPTNVYSATKTVTAAITCTPPTTFYTISWGDQTTSVSGPAPQTLTHAYDQNSVHQGQFFNGIVGTNVPFSVNVNNNSQYLAFPSPVTAFTFAGFAGQQSSVSTMAYVPANMMFKCTTVVDANGIVSQADALHITCASTPATTVFAAATPFQPVTIVVGTSGLASTFAFLRSKAHTRYALLMPLPACLLFAFAYRSRRKAFRRLIGAAALVTSSLTIVSCGGGFGLPKLSATVTPPGQYQVTVVSYPADTTTTTFTQTTLIVPLTVNPPQ